MEPPVWRGWRKKYSSPASGTDPGIDSAVGSGFASVACGSGSGVVPRIRVGGTGDPSKSEAGVGVEEQAVKRIKVRVTIRFMESPCQNDERLIEKFPLPFDNGNFISNQITE